MSKHKCTRTVSKIEKKVEVRKDGLNTYNCTILEFCNKYISLLLLLFIANNIFAEIRKQKHFF